MNELKVDFVGDARKAQVLLRLQTEAISKALEQVKKEAE